MSVPEELVTAAAEALSSRPTEWVHDSGAVDTDAMTRIALAAAFAKLAGCEEAHRAIVGCETTLEVLAALAKWGQP